MLNLCFLFMWGGAFQLFGYAAPPITVKFKVKGNCEMCRTRIEGALKATSGVKSAKWSVLNQEVTVKFSPEKVNEKQLHQKVAAVGYDTDDVKAPEAVYAKLPQCCRYYRGD